MFEFSQLTLFPPGALQSSVITTVWVGVCIVVFLNARFGTTLAGLVVPGYLVPLFFVKPISACVVLVEAYITYGLAYLLANKLLVRLGYSEMFGRDRFFALILLSVLVRIVLDFFAIPVFIEHFGDYIGNYDLKSNLQSFGLIIVALIANQMWMGGVYKGTKSLVLYLGLTFIVINWLLVPLTNFNIGGLNYMYEDLATSLLSSPKAYIILLTTAFIASRMNLQFGWEFNGILIPALLALQWYQPEKLLFTFIEAGVILFLGMSVMRLRILKGVTFEGGRLLLLFFNVGFVYKILLGFALIEFLPSVKISDYYGFGYVVSTLIAVKVYQKKIALKMAVSTLFTSLAGITLATIVGFLLTLTSLQSTSESSFTNTQFATVSDDSVLSLYNEIRPTSTSEDTQYIAAESENINKFGALVRELDAVSVSNIDSKLPELNKMSNELEMKLWYLQRRILVLYKAGLGFYAINLEPESALILEVPKGGIEIGSSTLALAIFQNESARAVFIDLSYQRKRSGENVFDSEDANGYFHTLHQQFASHNVLQINGDVKLSEQRITEVATGVSEPSQLKVLRLLPTDLPLSLLNSITNDLSASWTEIADNPQFERDAFGIAQLYLRKREMLTALARVEIYKNEQSEDKVENIEGYLISWLLQRKDLIARKGTESFERPTDNLLLFWYQDILLPLMSWLQQYEQVGWTEQVTNELSRINLLADSVNYELRILEQPNANGEFLILQEKDVAGAADERSNWATLVINLTANNPTLIKVPNPYFERTSFEFGAVLFKQLNNRFLLLSGAHPWANQDGSSNVTLTGNSKTLYHIMYMAIMKEFQGPDMLPVQVRGFSYDESNLFPDENALISLSQNLNQFDLSDNIKSLVDQLGTMGMSYRFVKGDAETGRYYLSINQQIDYLNFLDMDDFITVWISPLARDSFKATEQVKIEEQHARLLGIPVFRQDLSGFSMMQELPFGVPASDLLENLSNYALNRNVHSLKIASSLSGRMSLAYVLDQSSLQQYIAVLDNSGSLLSAINLNSLNQQITPFNDPDSSRVFISSRNRWLLPEPWRALL